MTAALYQLPDEVILATLTQQYPCREQPIRTLLTLLHVSMLQLQLRVSLY
jgi:hypothetical protein